MKGKEIKIGEGKKTFHSVMGMWNDKGVASLKKRNNMDDEEGVVEEGGYNFDTGHSRESVGWQMRLLREGEDIDNKGCVNDDDGDEDGDGDRDRDGDGDLSEMEREREKKRQRQRHGEIVGPVMK